MFTVYPAYTKNAILFKTKNYAWKIMQISQKPQNKVILRQPRISLGTQATLLTVSVQGASS
jgi:hypothetical protein